MQKKYFLLLKSLKIPQVPSSASHFDPLRPSFGLKNCLFKLFQFFMHGQYDSGQSYTSVAPGTRVQNY